VPARPRARARTAPSVAGGSNPAANAVLAKAPDSRRQRVLAAMMLALLAAALWWFGGAESRGPRLLGSLGGAPGSTTAAAPATVVGGIGRFARPRAGRPQPLT
ncbi:MAG: hypothetical protein JWO37_3514, partial [Acidimicrobiales bacterium]|nr:hypothetical protein [Acidimicrobiales bacterium]